MHHVFCCFNKVKQKQKPDMCQHGHDCLSCPLCANSSNSTNKEDSDCITSPDNDLPDETTPSKSSYKKFNFHLSVKNLKKTCTKSSTQTSSPMSPRSPNYKNKNSINNTQSLSQSKQTGNESSNEQMIGTSPRYRLSSDIYSNLVTSVRRGYIGENVVAVKIYKLKQREVTLASIHETSKYYAIAVNESRLLGMIPPHRNIIKYHSSEDMGDEYHIVCEYCVKSVFDMIERKPLHSGTCKQMFYQLLSGLLYLHNMKICHRDIKPENLLITFEKDGKDAVLKIADFGFATCFREDELLTVFCGTMLYAAPELIQSQPYDGPLSDVWSSLVTLHAMASSRSLFGGVDNVEICARILERPIRISHHVPPDIAQFLVFGLKRDPKNRPTIAQLMNQDLFYND